MPILPPLVTPHVAPPPHHPPHYLPMCFLYPMSPHMMLGRNILIQFAIFQKSGLLAEIGHFEVFSGIFGVTDLTLGHPRVAPEGFILLYYPYPVPKLLAEAFLGLGPDLVHLTQTPKEQENISVKCKSNIPRVSMKNQSFTRQR